MATPKTGGATPARKSRTGEVPVVVEPTASSNDNNNNNNNNNGSSSSSSNGTATTQKVGGVSRLPSIKERRPSVQKKARSSSVNDATSDTSTTTTTTSTTTLQRQESTNSTISTATVQRRTSVTQGSSLQSVLTQKSSRPTFAGIGRRVSSLVRARMAFQNRRKSTPANADEPNHMEHIHEMPRNPRFSTFLSPEAQYAMMKGYEDKLYEKIAKTNPESRLVLKRNKTPFHKKISIVDNEDKIENGDGMSAAFQGNNSVSITPLTTISPMMSPEFEGLESADESGDSTPTTLPITLRKPTRTQSTVTPDVSRSLLSSTPRTAGSVGFALHRSSSLPALNTGLSHRKRLVLTYRLESAMDILDTLKRRNKENSLSPRVFRIPRQVDAVRDFNSWTKVWNKEFKVVQAK